MPDFEVLLKQSPVACVLLVVIVAASVAAFVRPSLKEKWMLRPHTFVHQRKYITLLSGSVIHGDAWHLITNVVGFALFAFRLEHYGLYLQVVNRGEEAGGSSQAVAELLGHFKFFLIYLGALVIADLTTILRYRNDPAYSSLGASGAISGVVMGAVILSVPMRESGRVFGAVPGWVFALLFLGYSYFASRWRKGNVAHTEHLWGALGGIVLTVVLYPQESWVFAENMVRSIGELMGR